jgi:hypothetical protein
MRDLHRPSAEPTRDRLPARVPPPRGPQARVLGALTLALLLLTASCVVDAAALLLVREAARSEAVRAP